MATLAYGVAGVDRCDIIVGPGNKWVTAAKSLISGICAIGKEPNSHLDALPAVGPQRGDAHAPPQNQEMHSLCMSRPGEEAECHGGADGCTYSDMLAGPSEVLVIADETADAKTIAADLLAQVGEHSPTALVKPSCPFMSSHQPFIPGGSRGG